jgi:hypothetical protein
VQKHDAYSRERIFIVRQCTRLTLQLPAVAAR